MKTPFKETLMTSNALNMMPNELAQIQMSFRDMQTFLSCDAYFLQ